MDILSALATKKSQQENLSVQINQEHMNPAVFRIALERLGCDSDIIEDCLFEFPEKWEWLLKYFEDKKNDNR